VAGVAVAGVGTGAGEVGAAALALGALSAGLALALAAGAAAAGLAVVCSWTADANETIPATADNQKALLRRITTLSERLRMDTGWLLPRHRDSIIERSPKLRPASSSARAFPPSRIFTVLREVATARGA